MASDVDRRAMVLEAMMNDLGNDRLEDLAKDHRDGNRILKCSIQNAETPPPRVLTNENARGWNLAFKSGKFQDVDARGVAGLDDIAGGRLHAINRGQQRGDWHEESRSGNTGFSQRSRDPINSSWKLMKAVANGSNISSSNYDPTRPNKPLSTPRQTPIRTPDHAENRAPRPTPTRPVNHAASGWNAFGTQQTSKQSMTPKTVIAATSSIAQGVTRESDGPTTQTINSHRNESTGVSNDTKVHDSSPRILPHMRGPKPSDQSNSSAQISAAPTNASLPDRPVSRLARPLISAQLKSIGSVIQPHQNSINGDADAAQVPGTTARLSSSTSDSPRLQIPARPRTESTGLPHQRTTEKIKCTIKYTTQSQLNIFYNKEVKACRQTTSGNIETVPGRMYLYQYPGKRLIIWEIKWSDGWVEREDLRNFIALFRKSPSRMIVRRSGGSQAGIRTTTVSLEDQPPAPLTATLEFENKIKGLNMEYLKSSEPRYPYIFEKHEPSKGDQVDPSTLLPLSGDSENGQVNEVNEYPRSKNVTRPDTVTQPVSTTRPDSSPRSENLPRLESSIRTTALAVQAQHSTAPISKKKTPSASLGDERTTEQAQPPQRSTSALDPQDDALHKLFQGLGEGLGHKTSHQTRPAEKNLGTASKKPDSDKEIAKDIQGSNPNCSSASPPRLPHGNGQKDIGINNVPSQDALIEARRKQLEEEISSPPHGTARQDDEPTVSRQVSQRLPAHRKDNEDTERMASFDLIDTSPFTAEEQPSAYTMALEEISQQQNSNHVRATGSSDRDQPRPRIKEEFPEPDIKSVSGITDDQLQSNKSVTNSDVPSSRIPSVDLINAAVLAKVPLGVGLSRASLIVLSCLGRGDYQDLSKSFDESLYWLQQTGMYNSGSLNEFAAVHETLKHLERRSHFKMLKNEDRVKIAAVVYSNLKKIKVCQVSRYTAKALFALRHLARPCPTAVGLVNDVLLRPIITIIE
ncbi:hypothetical protein G7054_g6732 [Neopestalotiopsis clavispora]|nr:hypothetical protein G7054_g6732 [Neopestalotiopsis clavispora]